MTMIALPTVESVANKKRLAVVDGLRGVAILLVIYQHGFAPGLMESYKKITGFAFPYVMVDAWMGVSFFFVLSGFVLALPYFIGRRNITSPGEIKRYYLHRANRLLPLFIFVTFVSLAFYIHKGEVGKYRDMFMMVSTASMLSDRYFFPSINPAFWSLMVEIWFSIALPVVLLSINKFGLKKTALSIFSIALALRIGGSYYEFGMVIINPLKDFFIARCDDFVAGMVVCYLYINGRLPNKPKICLAAGIVLVLLAALAWDFITLEKIPRVLGAFTNIFASVGFSLVLVAALQSKSLLSRFFSMWWLRLLGAMCFSIYCWHLLVISQPLIENLGALKMELQFWLTLLVLSAFTYRYIENAKETSIKKIFMLNG
ncbi:acyltransferase [Pseudomonas sp. NFXW11]|uniref:acyltransferase family protein n=1 Tax=Pseudomonas sp. NFXW11 TaxID=2819531 RepID=UPI003CED5797